MKQKQLILVPLLLLWSLTYGQTRYGLQEAIQYGISHNVNIKNAQTDAASASSRIGEIRAVGLPQVNANVTLINNPI
ncbi:MAG: TolC family protein, partial [Runella slithyformis]